jgi:F-type H+-transporting ATPase subunit b
MTRSRRARAGRFGWIVAAAVLLCAAPAWAESAGSRTGDVGQALAALAIFALLALILGKYAWKPVIAQLRRREEEIGERIRDTDRRQREAQELHQQYQAKMDHADEDARTYLAEQLQQANQRRDELLAAAREQGREAIEAAEAEIDLLKRNALHDLQETTAELAVDIAGEVIREELDGEQHARLMDESLRRIRDRVAEEPK